MPISRGSHRKFLPTLDQQDTSVAYFPWSLFKYPETFFKVRFISFAVCESGTWWLGSADAAAFQTSVNFGFVKTKHLDFCVSLKSETKQKIHHVIYISFIQAHTRLYISEHYVILMGFISIHVWCHLRNPSIPLLSLSIKNTLILPYNRLYDHNDMMNQII